MVSLLILAFGVCCALLCHWMIRHTYEDWDWQEYDKPTDDGRRREKIWNVKLLLPRYVYILLWLLCIILAPIAIACPIAIASIIRSNVSSGDWHFHCENRLWKWVIGIRDWFTKMV